MLRSVVHFSVLLVVVGTGLLVVALFEQVTGFAWFARPPWLAGGCVAALGAVVLAEFGPQTGR